MIRNFQDFVNESKLKDFEKEFPEFLDLPVFIYLRQDNETNFSVTVGCDIKTNKNFKKIPGGLIGGFKHHPPELPGDYMELQALTDILYNKFLKNKKMSKAVHMVTQSGTFYINHTLTISDKYQLEEFFKALKDDNWSYKNRNCFIIFENYNECKDYIDNFKVSDFI